jgi:tetratricopeptide (TPR) repeat protein
VEQLTEKVFMRVPSLLCLPIVAALATPVLAGGQASPSQPPDSAEAYYQFLIGRYLEGEGRVDDAIEAHRHAADLDPTASEVPAELAGLYARQGQLDEAVAAAERALGVDSANVEAHRVLGSIYASFADAGREGRYSADEAARLAIEHLEQGYRPDGTDEDPRLDLTLGRLYLQLHDAEKAVQVLGRLVTEQPQVGEAYVLLARAETALGRADHAAALLEDASAGHPRLLSTLADLYERQRSWTDAARTYERLAEITPNSMEVKLRWAAALLQAGPRDAAERARTLLVEVTTAVPSHARAMYLRSNAERRIKDFDAAEDSARRVIALDPDGWSGPFALSQVFEDRHQYSRVIETLEPVAARMANDDEASSRDLLTLLAHLGYAQLQAGFGRDAVQTFEKARSLSRDPEAFEVSLVQAHMLERDYRRAALLARSARRRGTVNDLRLFQLEAQALVSDGRADRAVVVMRDAVDSHPDDIQAYLSLSQTLDEADRRGEADSVLDRAAARFPDEILVSFQRGALLERRREYEAAEDAFRQVLKRDPLHAPALNYLGYMLAERGDRLEEAVSLVERALTVDPDNPSYLDSLGWAFFQQRRFDKAEPLIRRAARRLPVNSVVHDHLGDLLWEMGRHEEARDAWRRALAGDRESVDVDAIERKVERDR